MRAFLLLMLALAGCGDDVTPRIDAAVPCELRTVTIEVRAPDRSYRALPADAELVLGFQGFRYVYLRVSTEGRPSSDETSALVRLDSGEVVSQSFRVELAEETPGHFVGTPQMLFFNDSPLPGLVDSVADLTVRVGDARCNAEARGTFTVRYDPSCYEGPAGDRICPDGGASPSDAGTDGGP